MLKTVSHLGDEIAIGRLLSRDDVANDPTNHCVPIFQVLQDPIDKSKAIIVMKYLRPFNDPELRTIGEVVDFIAQTLEVRLYGIKSKAVTNLQDKQGISFLHRQRVAHRFVLLALCVSCVVKNQGLCRCKHHDGRRTFISSGSSSGSARLP